MSASQCKVMPKCACNILLLFGNCQSPDYFPLSSSPIHGSSKAGLILTMLTVTNSNDATQFTDYIVQDWTAEKARDASLKCEVKLFLTPNE